MWGSSRRPPRRARARPRGRRWSCPRPARRGRGRRRPRRGDPPGRRRRTPSPRGSWFLSAARADCGDSRGLEVVPTTGYCARPRRMSLLTLTTSQELEAVHIALEGELELSSALLFDEELRRTEHDAAADTVVLDLSTLKFMDSTGLRLILSAHQRARRAGRHLRIIPGGDAIRRIFRLTGVWKRLDIVEDGAPSYGDRAARG